jgi:hypothetical protein
MAAPPHRCLQPLCPSLLLSKHLLHRATITTEHSHYLFCSALNEVLQLNSLLHSPLRVHCQADLSSRGRPSPKPHRYSMHEVPKSGSRITHLMRWHLTLRHYPVAALEPTR